MDREALPRCPALDGSTLRIVPAYTEAGRLCEANCVTITDGVRTAVYVPLATARDTHGDPTVVRPGGPGSPGEYADGGRDAG